MMKNYLVALFFIACKFIIFSQEYAKTSDGKDVLLYNNGTWVYANETKESVVQGLEIPKTKPTDTIVKHTAYSLLYNEKYEQANWVAYELTKEETNKVIERSNKFVPDPKVVTGSAQSVDYAGSGYDRGHLAPAADMSFSEITMQESFYYSNMSPQTPAFNRGIWKKLEELVRSWAVENEAIYVVTGPILTSGLPTIGPDKVAVPAFYYKVILDYTNPDIKAIAFVIPNVGSDANLNSFVVNIDKVEALTGIDFFPQLPDEEENKLEKMICIDCWSW